MTDDWGNKFFDAFLREQQERLTAPLPDEVINQVKMLRKQCLWQRAKGTDRDNGYPYHKHLPDCDICRSADLIERLARDRDKALQATIDISDEHTELQTRIEELEDRLTLSKNQTDRTIDKLDAALAALDSIASTCTGSDWAASHKGGNHLTDIARTEAQRIREMK